MLGNRRRGRGSAGASRTAIVAGGALLACLGLVLLLDAPIASAAKPAEDGWWRGSNDEGTHVAFAVERVAGKPVVTGVVIGCDTTAGIPFGAMHAPSDLDVPFTDPVGAPVGHAAYPITRSGRIDTRPRTIRSPRAPSGGRLDVPLASPISGRLRGDHARVKLTDDPVWSSSACADAANPDPGDVLNVEAVGGGEPVRSGVWRAEGLLPFGEIVDYAAGLFYVQPSGVVGAFRGMFLGPAVPPPDRRPNPLYSPWPLPCFDQNVADDAFEDGDMAYDFNAGFLLDETVIGADGTLHTLGGTDPSATTSFAWVQTDGSFTSSDSYEGSYRITESPALTNPNWCIDVDIPFEAKRVEPAAPLVVGALEDPGPKVGSGRDYLTVPLDPTEYVGLGDSYSSGEGVPPFDPETATEPNRCHRSTRAYSRLFSPPGYRLNRSFFACSGGTTENLGRLDAAGAIGGTPQAGEPSIQLARLSAGDWAKTDMVTLTVGGNDARFGKVLAQCLVPRPCHRGKRAKRIKQRIADEVPPLLASSYSAVRRTAPNASLFVLGYPQLFPDHPPRRCSIRRRGFITRSKMAFLRERGEQLNQVIAEQAAAAGAHFIGVERTFAGHEPCGRKREWIHALVPQRGKTAFSFHPNSKGQRAYANRLTGYFKCLAAAGFAFRRSGVPEAIGPERAVPKRCR
ncbi:MAG: hypothetical protein GEU88_01855 [Solirubrobacterales bacterium]|nr:hypothetical protein [Solirubrobacterales bacterium]